MSLLNLSYDPLISLFTRNMNNHSKAVLENHFDSDLFSCLSLFISRFCSALLPGGALDGPGDERGLAQRADTKPAGCHLGADRDRSSLH